MVFGYGSSHSFISLKHILKKKKNIAGQTPSIVISKYQIAVGLFIFFFWIKVLIQMTRLNLKSQIYWYNVPKGT